MKPSAHLFAAPVVPLDGSEISERALPVAAALAQQAGTIPTLVMAVSHPDHVARGEELLARAADRLGTKARTEVLIGLPAASALIDRLHRDGSVVIMSTHAHHALGELLLGSVAEEVVRRSARPLVLVGPRVDLPPAGSRYQDLVACIDANDAEQRLAPVVRSCATQLAMKPWYFQVVSPDVVPNADVVESALVEHAADRLARDGIEADWEVGHDDSPARSIVAFAESRTTPIVALATHGRDPEERLRASSTTVTVARHATCPVLVVGPRCSFPGS